MLLRLLLCAALVLPALASSGSVADARLRMELDRAARAESRVGGDSDLEVPSTPAFLPVLVQLSDPVTGMATLTDAGSVIMGHRGDIVLACVPYDCIDILDSGAGLYSASMASRVSSTLDVALAQASVNEIHNAVGIDSPYDGTGVVTGFCDIGFDPRHQAFAEGRLKRLVVYDTFNGLRTEIDDPYETESPESPDEYHATHVGAILAGGVIDGFPYHGAAPGSDIVATVSDLTDVAILAGIDDIIEYASEAGKPAVINISLSSYIGPHDGSTLFNRYLDMQSREAIICMSAGNNGRTQTTLHQTFRGDDEALATCLTTWDNLEISGNVDVWCSDSSPVSVALGVWDTQQKIFVGTMSRPIGSRTTISSVGGDDIVAGFSNAFDGTVEIDAEMNRLNGRGHMVIAADYKARVKKEDGTSRYLLALSFTSRRATRIDLFAEGRGLMLRGAGIPAGRYGDASMSFNDLAASDGAIMVGMANDRSIVPLADGGTWDAGFSTGVISPDSSYGIRPDGCAKPDITAPGNLLVSALSGRFYDAHSDALRVSAVSTDDSGHEHRWFGMGGTSMSSPLVAGTIATWAQAFTDLDVATARRALQYSADTPADADDPRYGSSGTLNGLRGLVSLLNGNVRLDEITSDTSGWLKIEGRTLSARATPSSSLSLYDLTGRCLAASASSVLDASAVPAGVYIVRDRDVRTARILLK